MPSLLDGLLITECDRMSSDELAARGAYELGRALNEVMQAIAELGGVLRSARDRVTAAKIAALRAPRDLDLKAARFEAEADLQHVRDRASVLKQYLSIIQSLLRAATII